MGVRAALAILLAGVMLVWPAFLNGYPILFSDTGAFLAQTVQPLMIWDKPWIYGPVLHAFHWGVTLWLPLLAQGLVLSHLLWLCQRVLRGQASAGLHLLLCAALALLTAQPWVTALLMPDVLTPMAALSLFLLGLGRASLSRGEAAYLTILAALAIAAHLSNLPLAAALLVATALLARRLWPVLRVAAPLALALLLLLGTNWAGHGRLSVSPYGSTFLLARMIGDGTAARTIAARCPQSGWYLCFWSGRLPADSDDFLWQPDSPLNRDELGRPIFLGGVRLASEAREIVAETIRREPFGVAWAALRNAAHQLVLVEVGDTLGRENLGTAARPRIEQGFGPGELARYDASAQSRDLLRARAAPFLWPHGLVLLASAAGLAVMAWGRRGPARAFALWIFVAVAANALATGALSKPHHRYQARIAWLMPLGVALLAMPRRQVEAPPPAAVPG
ncbi:hypothetical protein [Roseomonas marmotae]|uniref:Glycosyltransferase RgtA/B/C/D-like domain-containing protein n=1 Tax=Roseomonas marmotae TaxID=2768161 RepID=A0ABS3KIM2_9PROT|nr:hypothetical protein [Roseomonas marmotae]MBO1076473.1 hypothetical protein [Roseomonas marmotae]QTI77927.1 hypothetical protein IAI58_09265 [Roseomonas marmotae]